MIFDEIGNVYLMEINGMVNGETSNVYFVLIKAIYLNWQCVFDDFNSIHLHRQCVEVFQQCCF